MKVGLDYHDTISAHPDAFRQLATALLAAEHEVHIISAVGPNHVKQYTKEIKRSKVPATAVHMLVYDRHYQAPKLKLEKCIDIGINLFIDDRADTCALLAAHGILALKVYNFAEV